MFENVNIDWNLVTAEDASTDFSDDDVADERVSFYWKYFSIFTIANLLLA